MERLMVKFFVAWIFLAALSPSRVFSSDPAVPTEENPRNDEHSWDFGRVKEGSLLEHDFIISNRQEDPIRIKEIVTSCSCTASKITRKELAPGESTVLKVHFKTDGYKGRVYQYVYVNIEKLGQSKTDKQAAEQAEDSILRFKITADLIK